jgi:hypothetical protein
MSQFHMEALLVSPAEMSLTGDLKAELDERSVVHRQVDSVEECISDADVIYMEPVVQADYTKAREEAAGDRPRTPAAYRVTPELDRLDGGRVPALEELRLHQGTVWTWNRAIYDPTAGGHLRVEMRALPAGPTVVDMLANAAFHLGLALRWPPTPAPGPAGCRSSRPTTTSTAPPSSAWERRWRGRWTLAGGSGRCPWPSWPAGCSPPPGRASRRPASPATRSTGSWP